MKVRISSSPAHGATGILISVSNPTKEELKAAEGRKIPDVVADRLDVLFVGINPSLYSAAVGHHFARPGNRFWPALSESGFTDRLLSPDEDARLVEYGCGLTNMVARATARADELSNEELKTGGARLEDLVRRIRPKFVAFVGITAYRTAFGQKDAVMGPQDRQIGQSAIWVLPNPSGLNAHYQLPDFVELFTELRESL